MHAKFILPLASFAASSSTHHIHPIVFLPRPLLPFISFYASEHSPLFLPSSVPPSSPVLTPSQSVPYPSRLPASPCTLFPSMSLNVRLSLPPSSRPHSFSSPPFHLIPFFPLCSRFLPILSRLLVPFPVSVTCHLFPFRTYTSGQLLLSVPPHDLLLSPPQYSRLLPTFTHLFGTLSSSL